MLQLLAGFSAIIAIFSYLIYEIFNKTFKYRQITKHMPSVYGLPISGVLYKFVPIQSKSASLSSQHKIFKISINFLGFFYVIESYFHTLNSWSYLTWFANIPLIITIDTEIIKHILNSDEFLNKAGVIYKVMDEALPNGIITSKCKFSMYIQVFFTSFLVVVIFIFRFQMET